ncbi:unnamed protein product, partial [Ceratitis capitata]
MSNDDNNEGMKTYANQEAVTTFILGLNSKNTSGTLYGHNPGNLESAYATACTIFHDNVREELETQFKSLNQRQHHSNQDQPPHREGREYKPNVRIERNNYQPTSSRSNNNHQGYNARYIQNNHPHRHKRYQNQYRPNFSMQRNQHHQAKQLQPQPAPIPMDVDDSRQYIQTTRNNNA